MIWHKNHIRVITIITISLLIFSLDLRAQKFFEIRFKGGFNLSLYIGKGSNTSYWEVGSRENRIKPGLILGVYLIHVLRKNLFLQVELLYVQKGAHVSFQSVSYGSGEYYKMKNSWKGTQSLTYFELPVMIKFKDFSQLPFKSLPYFGVSFASLYKAEAKYDFKFIAEDESGNITDEYSEKDLKYDIYHTIKPIDIEIMAGITIPFNRICFDVRYSISLLPVNQHSQVRNHSLSATIGLPFN